MTVAALVGQVLKAGPVDGDLRFHAVRNPLPGAGTYEWTRALREPSYRLAQD